MRISTTTLESFRLFMQPEQEWMTEDDLLATIRGQFVGNHKVWLGLAFGSVLEAPDRYRVAGGYRVANLRGCPEVFEFGDEVMAPALALIDAPRTVFEAKGLKRYGEHDVVAKADQLVGARLIETKTTLGTFDFDKYANACQWRFMVDIFRPVSVTYHVFLLDEGTNGVVSLKGTETFTLYPYAELHQDCAALVEQFAAYVTAKGLRSVLDARQREAA